MVFEHVTIKIDIGVSSFSDNPICLVLLLFWTQNRWRRKFWRPSGAKRWSYTHRTPGMLQQVHWVLSSLIEVLLGNLGNAMACDGICMMVTCRIGCETVPVNPVGSEASLEGFLTLGHTVFLAGEMIAFCEFLGANLHIPTVFPGANLHVISQLSGASNHWLLHALPGDARIQKMSAGWYLYRLYRGLPKKIHQHTPASFCWKFDCSTLLEDQETCDDGFLGYETSWLLSNHLGESLLDRGDIPSYQRQWPHSICDLCVFIEVPNFSPCKIHFI